MSLTGNNQDPLPAPSYGVLEFDLTTARTGDDELVRARNARALSVLQVDAEANIRLGGTTAPAIDLRDFAGSTIARRPEVTEPLGEIYVQNPSASAGDTLKLFLGGDVAAPPQVTVDSISDISTISDSVELEEGGSTVTTSNPLSVDLQKNNIAGGIDVDLASASTAPLGTEENAVSQTTNSTSSNGSWISLDLSRRRRALDVGYDVSGSATLTVEASHDGSFSGEEFTVDQVSVDGSSGPAGNGEGIESYGIAYQHTRAKINTNLNTLRMVSRGAE